MEYGDVLTGRIVKYPTVRLFYCQEKEMERHVMQTQDVAKLLNVAETTGENVSYAKQGETI